MALIRADRVKESSTSTGTGAFLLAGADSTYRTFASVCAVADTVYYAIAHRTSNEWEVGLGTYSATNTLTRTTVHASSNANAAVTFSAGTKDVLLALTKTQLETYATLAGTETLTNKTINASSNTITNVSLTTGVTGTLPLGNGGTGTTTAQLAMNALAGAVTSGSYLRGNGTNVVMATIQAADVPTLNQNTTGTASNVNGIVAIANGGTGASDAATARANLALGTMATQNNTNVLIIGGSISNTTINGNISGNADNVTGTVAIANGGTGQTTAANAINALLPSQSTNTGKFLTTNGTAASWATVTSNAGTVTSVGGTGTVSGITLTGTVTSSGNLTLGGTLSVTASNFSSQTANTVLAAPNGAAGTPTFRALVAADIPTLNQNTTGTASGSVSGTASYVPKFTGTNVVGNSLIYDSGLDIGIGTTSPATYGAGMVVYRSVNAGVGLSIVNPSPTSAASSTVLVGSAVTGGSYGFLSYNSNYWAGTGLYDTPATTVLFAGGSAGLHIGSSSGRIKFFSNSISTIRMQIGTDGFVGINETSPGAQLQVTSAAAATKGVIVRGASAQSANLTEWQNSSGTVLSAVKSDGSIQPASMADSAAANNSIYYSTTASKLVYKDSGGTVNNLY